MLRVSVTQLPAPGATPTVVLHSPIVLPWQPQQPQQPQVVVITSAQQQQRQLSVVSVSQPVPSIRPCAKIESKASTVENLATEADGAGCCKTCEQCIAVVLPNSQHQSQPPASLDEPTPFAGPSKSTGPNTRFERQLDSGSATIGDGGIDIDGAGIVKVEIPSDPEGVRIRSITEFERQVYVSIYDRLYLEAATCSDSTALEDAEAEPRKPGCCEQCIDWSCQSCVCDFTTAFERLTQADLDVKPRTTMMKTEIMTQIMTPILRHGRAKGWEMFTGIVLPLLHSLAVNIARDVWLSAELLTTIVAFTLSVATFTLGNNAAFNALHLALASLSTLLAVIDALVNLTQFRSCKSCQQNTKRRIAVVDSETQLHERNAKNDSEIQWKKTKSEDVEVDLETQLQCEDVTMIEEAENDSEIQWKKTNGEVDPETQWQTTVIEEAEEIQWEKTKSEDDSKTQWKQCLNSQCCKTEKCCGKCLSRCKTLSDFIRMIVTELILYPLLVCDIFELVTDQTYKGGTTADRISFALFILSSLALFLYVYFLRLLILAAMMHFVQKQRTLVKDRSELRGIDYDPSIGKSALTFQSLFFVHVLGQMVAQTFMLIAIGGKIEYDNRHLFDSNSTDEQIYVSPYLWYMIISGYILPVAGILTFFIVAYYWVQEFPIGICIDLLSILELPSVDRIFSPNDSLEETRKKVSKIMRFVHFAELKQQYKDMRGKGWFKTKFLYPFRTPAPVILSIIYGSFQLGFILCAIFTGGIAVVVLNGGNWVFFYIAGVVVGVAVNVYVFTVAAVWNTIIIVVLVIIVIVLIVIALTIPSILLYGLYRACRFARNKYTTNKKNVEN